MKPSPAWGLPLLLGALVHANELSPELVAKIRRDQKAAQQAIDKAHEGKKPAELTAAERREAIRKQAEAERQILDRHQVDLKDYTVYTTKMSKDVRRKVDEAENQLEQDARREQRKAETEGHSSAMEVEHGIPAD